MSAIDASGVAIAVQSSPDPSTIACIARSGATAPALGALLDVNSGISGMAIRENRTLHSNDTTLDPRVDKEACQLLGIRSVVAVPLLRDSCCIGVLEVFSDRPNAFHAASLTRIEAEAVRATGLINRQAVDTNLPDPKNWGTRRAGFRLDYSGRLSQFPPATADDAKAEGNKRAKIFSLVKLPTLSRAGKPYWQWIALISVATSLAFSAPRLLRHANMASTTHGAVSTAAGTSSSRVAASDIESRTALVNDAAPGVRVLMAKAFGGNNIAQASLADHYAQGDGVTEDRVKATVWAVIAIANGNAKASKSAMRMASHLQPYEIGQVQFNLGTMFRDGIGTSPNLVNAYAWFSLSEGTGDVRASAALLNLQQVMSAGDIAEAQRRASELQRHLKQ